MSVTTVPYIVNLYNYIFTKKYRAYFKFDKLGSIYNI